MFENPCLKDKHKFKKTQISEDRSQKISKDRSHMSVVETHTEDTPVVSTKTHDTIEVKTRESSPNKSASEPLSEMNSEKETKVNSSSSSTASKDLVQEREKECTSSVVMINPTEAQDVEKPAVSTVEVLDDEAKSRRESLAQFQEMGGVSWKKLNINTWIRDEVMFKKLNSAINLRLQQKQTSGETPSTNNIVNNDHSDSTNADDHQNQVECAVKTGGDLKNQKDEGEETSESISTENEKILPPPKKLSVQASYLPTLEKQYCKDYSCCGLLLPSLHDLLEHYEQVHITPGPAHVASNYSSHHNNLHLNNVHSTITSLSSSNNQQYTSGSSPKPGLTKGHAHANSVHKPTQSKNLVQHQQQLQQKLNQQNLLVQHGSPGNKAISIQAQQQQKLHQEQRSHERQLEEQVRHQQQQHRNTVEKEKNTRLTNKHSRIAMLGQQQQQDRHKIVSGLNDNLVDAVPTNDVFLNQDKNYKHSQEQHQLDLKNAFKNYAAINNNLHSTSSETNDDTGNKEAAKSKDTQPTATPNSNEANNSKPSTPIPTAERSETLMKDDSINTHVANGQHTNIFKKPSSVSPLNVSEKAKELLMNEVNIRKLSNGTPNSPLSLHPGQVSGDPNTTLGTASQSHHNMINPNSIKVEHMQRNGNKNVITVNDTELVTSHAAHLTSSDADLQAQDNNNRGGEATSKLVLPPKLSTPTVENMNDPHTNQTKTDTPVKSSSLAMNSADPTSTQPKQRSRTSSITSSMRSIHSDDEDYGSYARSGPHASGANYRAGSADINHSSSSTPLVARNSGSISGDGLAGDRPFLNEHARRMYLLEMEEDKPFKCPVIGCDKMYKNQNGLKYHRQHGHQGQKLYENPDGTFSIIDPESNQPYPDGMEFETDKPYRCDVCGKRYKNLNGLKYHRAHSTH